MSTDILMELPIVLRNMLGQLTQNNTLVGWNIYEDRHQKICLNIRFDIDLCGHVAGSVGTVSPAAQLELSRIRFKYVLSHIFNQVLLRFLGENRIETTLFM